jgi:hypothetical protein
MTVAPIIFPLVSQRLCDWLSVGDPQAMLAAIPDVNGDSPIECVVQSEVPNPRPPRMIALFTAPTAGAQRARVLSERRIIAQIYESSEWVTAQLAETASALIIQSMYEGLGIKRVKVIGQPARFPGPGVPWRWQFTADVMIRAIPGPWSTAAETPSPPPPPQETLPYTLPYTFGS